MDQKFLELEVFEQQGIKEYVAARPDSLKDKQGPLGIMVIHTHWDREWYLPFEGFRARLVAMMDGLLDILECDPDFRCFMLDGQAIMLEDYLEVRPEAEARVRHMVATKRLQVGPWYTSVDSFLPDPESIVRNLQLGRWAARRYGGEAMGVGYLPDTFGFMGQLPQVLQHFGIEDAFAWRGMHPEDAATACWWESPDGSKVLVMRPHEGYCEAAIGVVDPPRFLEEILPGILARQEKEPFEDKLYVVGCDHFPVSDKMPWLAEQIAQRVGHPVRLGTLEEMAWLERQASDTMPTIKGEQRDSCLVICPLSVIGTRIPMKQANQEVEALLLGHAEPLQALSELVGAGSDKAHLRWAWRLLTQNHAHDSIPGCSIDEVHREMFTRFARAKMVAKDVTQRAAKRLSAALSPEVRGELGAIGVVGLAGGKTRIKARLHGTDEGLPEFRITEQDGTEIPYTITGNGKEFAQYHRLEDAWTTAARAAYPHLVATREWVDAQRVRPRSYSLPWVDVELELEAPRAGYRALRIERGTPQSSVLSPQSSLKVWADTRGLYVEDTASGRKYGPVYFSHQGDKGDEYTACPLQNEAPVIFAPVAAKAKVEQTVLGERLTVPISAVVPARLRADRKGRTGKVRLEGKLVAYTVGNRIQLDIELDNRARDFDLRLVTHIPNGVKAFSGAPYTVEERPFQPDHMAANAPQQALPDFPIRGWLAAQDAEGAGMAVLARGLYEAAVFEVDGGVDLSLTLLRGIAYLSRADLETRPDDAGPAIPTPDAQCLGLQRCELALLPFNPGDAETLPVQAEQFLRPAALFPVQWSAGTAPASLSVFGGDEKLVVSTLKPAEEGNGATVHAYNPTTKERQAEIVGQRSRMDETPIPGGDDWLDPYAVAAWRLKQASLI